MQFLSCISDVSITGANPDSFVRGGGGPIIYIYFCFSQNFLQRREGIHTNAFVF